MNEERNMEETGRGRSGKWTTRGVSLFLAACGLLAGMAGTGAGPAYASENAYTATTGAIRFYPEESPATADSEVTGHIKVELISVEMPAGNLEFQVNTSAPFQVESPGEQIQSPAMRIRNRSVVPVKLEISDVADIREEDVHFSERFLPGKEDRAFRLVDQISGVGAPGTAILVLGVEGRSYSKDDFERDAIVPGKKYIHITDIPASGEQKLELYGMAASDFQGEYQFTVRPTLKISAVKATQAD